MRQFVQKAYSDPNQTQLSSRPTALEPAVCLPGAFPLPPHASGELSQEASSLSVNVGMNMRAVNWLACINSLVSAGSGGWTLHLERPALDFGEVVGGVGL